MAQFNSLTDNQKSTLLAYVTALRGGVIALSKALNTIQDLDSIWNSNAKAINALLDGTEVIPDPNGLAGSQTLTAQDVLTMMNAFETMLATNNSAAWRAYFVRAAGVGNTMQSG